MLRKNNLSWLSRSVIMSWVTDVALSLCQMICVTKRRADDTYLTHVKFLTSSELDLFRDFRLGRVT